MGGTVGGAIGTVAGSMLGFLGKEFPWITLDSIIETACFAVIGAVLGFYTNKLLKWLHK